MKRTLFAGLAGGIILFIWGALAWTVLPLHNPSLHNIANEDAVINTLRANIDTKGVYIFPGMPHDQGQAAMDVAMKKYQQGPVGMIIFDPKGSNPMMPGQMIVGLIISILSALIAIWFLSRSTAAASGYLARVAFFGMFGLFISVFAHLTSWNWMGYPFDYISAWIIDTIIGWLLAGIGITAIAKLPKSSEA
jgi:hypothetical protein